MVDASPALIALLIVCWATLAVLVAVFLRMAMRSDAGFGGAGRGARRMPPPTGSPSLPPGPLSPHAAGRR